MVKTYERLIAQKRFPGEDAIAQIPQYELHRLARTVDNGFYNAPEDVPRPYPKGADFYAAVPAIEAQLPDKAKAEEMLHNLSAWMDGMDSGDRKYGSCQRAKEQLSEYVNGTFSLFNHRHDAPQQERSFVEQVVSDVETIAASEPEAPERFYVIETDDGYAVWDDIRGEIYVDEEGVSEDFSSEWQAEDYLKQVKKAVSEKESAEWLYVEQSRNTAAEPETTEPAPLRPPVPRKKTHTALAHPLDTSGSNYCITDDHIGEGAPLERFQRNLDAIRLLKTVEAEDRTATAEEQTMLAQYVGWGGLADFFDEKNARYGELKELLTERKLKLEDIFLLSCNRAAEVHIVKREKKA